MEGGAGAYTSRMPEDVFRDFRARRAGMVKALTTGTSRPLLQLMLKSGFGGGFSCLFVYFWSL